MMSAMKWLTVIMGAVTQKSEYCYLISLGGALKDGPLSEALLLLYVSNKISFVI